MDRIGRFLDRIKGGPRCKAIEAKREGADKSVGTVEGFTATAVGDPACDGHPVTFTITGSVTNGQPSVTAP